ncbi:MAG: GNAT family N-acetyltransferase [Pseudomonadales bacterium]|nr:GNAT family N-acetyltransferase [Pseudomonadales bacterium]NIX09039.1 GNAT family N-acetyltransferase [Pseudomonadales bacterium]
MPTEVITHHLELTEPDQFRPAGAAPAYELRQVERPTPELNRFLYATIGADWSWYERLSWSRARWLAFLDRPEVATWIACVDGSPAGYFELEDQPNGSVEICYFGLLPAFTGQGMGGALLSDAVRAAWNRGASRVWLHTCSLDHPSALGNYLARGFTLFDTVRTIENLPERMPEPWPGCSGSSERSD